MLDVRRAPAPSRPAARPRRAHRRRRRGRGLRRPPAGDEHARRHHQARPRARGRRPHRPGEDRADRLAGALRALAPAARSAPRASRRSTSCACWFTSAWPTGRAGRSAGPATAGRRSTRRRARSAASCAPSRTRSCRSGTRRAEADQCLRRLPCWPASARCSSAPPRCATRTTSRSVLEDVARDDQRGARLPRRGGERLPPRLRRHAHGRRRGLGGLAQALLGTARPTTPGRRCSRRPLRAPRRAYFVPGRRVRLGRARRRDLRPRSRAERRPRRLAAGRRAVRAPARRARRAARRDLGRRARDRPPPLRRTSSTRW